MSVGVGKELVDKFELTVGGEPVEYLKSKEDLIEYIDQLEKQIEETNKERLQ